MIIAYINDNVKKLLLLGKTVLTNNLYLHLKENIY